MEPSPNHKKDLIALSYKPYKNICDVIIEGCFTGNLVSISIAVPVNKLRRMCQSL